MLIAGQKFITGNMFTTQNIMKTDLIDKDNSMQYPAKNC